MTKESAILMPLTSLPDDSDIGVIGKEAYKFIDKLSEAGIPYWQLLPVNIFDIYGCPYASPSAFGGDPLLLSLNAIDRSHGEKSKIDFTTLAKEKWPKLKKWALEELSRPHILEELSRFKENNFWAHDLSVFLTLKEKYSDYWTEWPKEFFDTEYSSRYVEDNLRPEYMVQLILQYEFQNQWQNLKKYSHNKNVKLIGDIPIFVSAQSFDTWKWKSIFKINQETGKALVITGAPPDDFSEAGQLWGTVNYAWTNDEVEEELIQWWIHRLGHNLELYDLVRIDHFIGLHHVWESPAEACDATQGQWVKGKGEKLLFAIKEHFPHMPFIAEDLGELSDPVEKLRDQFELPSMKVFQFSMNDNEKNDHLPSKQKEKSCYYSGTHDNNTLMGWLKERTPSDLELINKRLGLSQVTDLSQLQVEILKAVAASQSELTIFPIQDIFQLDESARINIPGTQGGNWSWRLLESQWNEERWQQFIDILKTSKRTLQ